MAVMYPENYGEIDFNSKSEDTMYVELQKQLSDQYYVYYSLKWNYIAHYNHGDGVQKDGECDFLIFNPEYGYIVLEVKGGKRLRVHNNKWKLYYEHGGYRILKESPYEQARKNMRYFKTFYNQHHPNKSYSGLYGYAVALPQFSVEGDYSATETKDLTIDLNDMNNLSARIKEIFNFWRKGKNTRFEQSESDKFKGTVNTCIIQNAAAGALIKEKEREFAKIDFVQDSILELLHNYSKVQIIGGAGTGKTYIAMKKAIRDAKLNKSVLYLCSDNKELLNFVEAEVNKKVKGNVDFKTYEDLIVGAIGREAYDHAPVQYKDNHEYKECFDLINANEIDKYDSIIVDEAQDFDEDMGCTTCLFLKDKTTDSSLYVFYDVDQNLYANDPKKAFLIDTKPYLLKYNIRNTKEIYKYAKEETGLGKDTVSSEIQGADPDIHTNNTPEQTIKDLYGILQELSTNGVSNDSIVILSNDSFENSILAPYRNKTIYIFNICYNKGLNEIGDQEICYRTVEEFKGLEANVVIYLEEDGPTIDHDDRYKKLEYTAYTRARYCLYILRTIYDN